MLKFEIDKLRLDGLKEEVISDVLSAATGAVQTATKSLEREIEALTRAGTPGDKVWRAWGSRTYPTTPRQPSYEPVGEIFVNGGRRSKGMISYWSRPGVNRKSDGYWLAIPTKEAGVQGRGRNLTPGDWERRTGMKLEFVFPRSARFGLLVARGVSAANGKGALRNPTALRLQRRGLGGGDVKTKVIFVLIPEQRHANSVSLTGVYERAAATMERSFDIRVNRAIRGALGQ